jgi:HEAT repeat protein
MNALALMKSQLAVNEYIEWASGNDLNIRASVYNALAVSGSPLAYPVLSKAAQTVFYRWERTGATASYLNYARVIGQNGNIKTMDKICKLVISKSNEDLNIQNKTAALDIYTAFHGIDAMPMLIKAAAHHNSEYRNAAMKMSLKISGADVVNKWINYFPKAIPAAKPEIITMLGDRRDKLALSLVTSSLTDQDQNIRIASAEAIVKISGSEALHSLINYLLVFNREADQEAAKTAIMTVAGSDKMPLLIPVLKDGPSIAKKSIIEILAWNKDNKYFSEILPFASSSDETVKSAAIKALVSLAGPSDQGKLIELLLVTEKPDYITNIQYAIAAAANKEPDHERRSYTILSAIEGNIQKEKLIPVLAKTGGSKALVVVKKEFENGNAAMRDLPLRHFMRFVPLEIKLLKVRHSMAM